MFVRYTRVNLCTKITNLTLKAVHYNRVFVTFQIFTFKKLEIKKHDAVRAVQMYQKITQKPRRLQPDLGQTRGLILTHLCVYQIEL